MVININRISAGRVNRINSKDDRENAKSNISFAGSISNTSGQSAGSKLKKVLGVVLIN